MGINKTQWVDGAFFFAVNLALPLALYPLQVSMCLSVGAGGVGDRGTAPNTRKEKSEALEEIKGAE
jgi:hypothetical protein